MLISQAYSKPMYFIDGLTIGCSERFMNIKDIVMVEKVIILLGMRLEILKPFG